MAALTPIAGRECGACTACCVELEIDAPELKKADGVDCPHMVAHTGCGIFTDRPSLCRHWFCGWRIMSLSEAMRPDRSGILLTPETGEQPGYQKGGLRIVLTARERAVLRNDELLDLVARCVTRQVPMWLSWGDGHRAKRYLVNDDLQPAIRDGDKAAFYQVLDIALGGLIADVEAQVTR